MKRLIQFSVRLYPPAWRARYGAEFGDLLQDGDPSLAVLVDVVRRGLEARLRSWLSSGPRGGFSVFEGVQRRAGLLGVIGLLVVLPTTVLVAVAVLKYVVGMAAPFDAIEPVLTPIVTHPLGETFFVLAPYAALMLVAMPVTRVDLGWRAGRMTATVNVSTPALNVAVAIMSIGLAVFMALYWVAENL